jgi:DNA-binding transcriptional LysR family regulator
MTLQQIRYAITIAEVGSMNKAAEELYISQPSLTCAIKELEKESGINIFLRTTKGVVTTSEGADFLMYARQVYQQYELLLQKYSPESRNIKRKFGVSTQHYSFAVKAFVETVKKFDTLKFEFAIRETKTIDVINDVGNMKSEIGILYRSGFNRKIIDKMLSDNDLSFFPLINCRAYVYLWKNHPLAKEESVSLEQLKDYPCLSFEQGESGSFYLAEEILSDNDYPRTIKSNDRATQLNLMVGLNGYTLCSGIICEELNGSDYIAVPFREDEENRNSIMEIGYIAKKHNVLSDIAKTYVREMKIYLSRVKDSDINADTN